MKRLLKIRYIVLASCLVFLFNGCVDDGLGFSADELREGETTVMLDVSFSPFSEGNLTRANIENGNGKLLSDLKDLCILVYDAEGNLVDDTKYPMKIELDSPEIKSNIKEVNRNDEDASNHKTAETSTKTLSGLSLNLPFGRYYIVAVSNLKNGTFETLKDNPDIKTLDGLRGMKVEWDNTNTENIKNNSELMGYFTDMEIDNSAPAANKAFSTVSVNRPGMKLRAWLRRCASKITIDFDGSKLRENVTVYIQKAEIKDIPYDCTLGFGQPSGFDESQTSYNHHATDNNPRPNGLLEDTPQVISYLKGGAASTVAEGDAETEFVKPDVTNWAKITKGMPVIKDNIDDKGYETANVINFHSENADALYFYENMQDNPDNNTKIPHADLVNGGVANSGVKKDGILYGTYIEVTGYYESNADGNYSHGNIKYRFMLGKDVTNNFEAERNYHYKLTLCPRGNGNDADWHIDFDEPKGFHVPNPWYVSYLYNHDAMLPFKYTPREEGWVIKEMTAEIITNPWYPSNFTDEQMMDPATPIEPVTPSGDESLPYETAINRDNGNGFLSLRAPKEDNVITLKDCGETGFNYRDDKYANLNNVYYKGGGTGNGVDKSTREIIKNYLVCNDTGNDRENIEYNKDGDSYTINIPLFTRAKVMVKQSGYSGNNPFVGYQRIARVKLKVTLEKDGETDTDEADVNVVQVRRVVNPKGVYRSKDNFSPFHVTMMFLSGDDANATFQPIQSRGPWTAEIIGDKNFITLDGKQKVSGSTDTPIDFSIRFNRMSSSGNKNAVVRVKYHNYTCTHLIFVRQGYDPQALCQTGNQWPLSGNTPTSYPGTVWSTFNMIAKNVEATDPRDEGSLFKFGNSEDPIDAVNNAYKIGGKEVYHNLTRNEFDTQIQSATGVFEKIDKDGKLVTDQTIKWTDITSDPTGFTDGEIAKAATIRDFEQLYLTPNIWFGYGVLYADGATETQSTLDMAYGYYRRDNSSNAKAKGMRGMFAYYWDGIVDGGSEHNGKNVFFPIGRSGYGHRKNNNEDEDPAVTNNKGILRYATRFKPSHDYTKITSDGQKPAAQYFHRTAPLFESIYRRPGGIYWARKTVPNENYLQWDGTISTDGVAYGLDINYFSFDVNAITGANINSGNDACFVRTVGGDNE